MHTLLFVFILLPFVFTGECPGLCENADTTSCSSGFKHGLCPGGNNIQCCEMATSNCNGQCQDNSLPCSGGYTAGLCPGPNAIECCGGSGPNPPPPATNSCAPFANSQWNCASPSCGSHVCTGCGQPNYECAEFVARSLASAGLIPLSPLSAQSEYGSFRANGKTYDLLWVSSKNGGIRGLEDYLKDSGWHECGNSQSCINDCSALMVTGSDGPYSHTVVGIAHQVVDAHNVARYQVSASFYAINDVWNPPANIIEIVERQRAEREKYPVIY